MAIVGPTGSGKSALALNLAEEFHGEIINCDSLQLYRGLDIGTAKTPVAERRGIPHHLFDVLDPEQGYSAGEYARQARDVVADVSGRGRLPIVAGGTGFYLRALIDGLPPSPARDPGLRRRLAAREERRPRSLHRLLTRLDPSAAARIHARDVQKVVRALEVRILTGRALPPTGAARPLAGYSVLQLGLDPDRSELYRRLDARVLAMFRPESGTGLIGEVQRLLARGCTGAEKPFESLGYKQALDYLGGARTLEEAIVSTQTETHQYAKRQWTWFRRDARVIWVRGFGDSPEILDQCRRILAG